jgi:hypothetical protein
VSGLARAASRDVDCDDDDEEVRTDSWRPWRRRYRVDEPLPASIDPDSAADLARELAAPLRRAHELLALLDRRAAEHWSDDEA